MKSIFIIDKKTKKIDRFIYYEHGPVPHIVIPPDPESPKEMIPLKQLKWRGWTNF